MANRVNSRLRIGACLLGLFSFAFAAAQTLIATLMPRWPQRSTNVLASLACPKRQAGQHRFRFLSQLATVLIAAIGFSASAQTIPAADDDSNVLIPIIAKLLNATITPTITASIQPTAAIYSLILSTFH